MFGQVLDGRNAGGPLVRKDIAQPRLTCFGGLNSSDFPTFVPIIFTTSQRKHCGHALTIHAFNLPFNLNSGMMNRAF
jgi:hypothetical protein